MLNNKGHELQKSWMETLQFCNAGMFASSVGRAWLWRFHRLHRGVGGFLCKTKYILESLDTYLAVVDSKKLNMSFL